MKIRISTRKQVRPDNVMMFLAVFFVFSYALLEHVSITIPVFSLVKFPLLYAGGFCLLTRAPFILSNVRRKKYFYVILTLLAFCLLLMGSGFANRDPVFGTNAMRGTFRLVLFLGELFALAIWICETGKADNVINFLFFYVLLLVIVTDVLLFTRLRVFYSGRHEIFLLGTKFTVAYFHMDLLTLWFIRNNMRFHREGKTKRFILFALPFILAVSIRVNCMTGVVGCVALFCFFLMVNTKFQRYFFQFGSPALLLVFLTASVVFPFIAERIVSVPFVSYLVQDIFSRSITLTGRLHIFEDFIREMQGHWMWGFGFNNGNVAAVRLFNCANAQNSLLQWVLETGIPATGMLVVLMLVIFQQLSQSSGQRKIMPMVVLLYVYIVLGMIETTFNMSFILWVALIFIQVNAREPQPKAEVSQ